MVLYGFHDSENASSHLAFAFCKQTKFRSCSGRQQVLSKKVVVGAKRVDEEEHEE